MQYSPLELWLLIALLALLTLVSRSFFVLLPRRWQPRGRVERRYAMRRWQRCWPSPCPST